MSLIAFANSPSLTLAIGVFLFPSSRVLLIKLLCVSASQQSSRFSRGHVSPSPLKARDYQPILASRFPDRSTTDLIICSTTDRSCVPFPTVPSPAQWFIPSPTSAVFQSYETFSRTDQQLLAFGTPRIELCPVLAPVLGSEALEMLEAAMAYLK